VGDRTRFFIDFAQTLFRHDPAVQVNDAGPVAVATSSAT
jgi:hypothetical protein